MSQPFDTAIIPLRAFSTLYVLKKTADQGEAGLTGRTFEGVFGASCGKVFVLIALLGPKMDVLATDRRTIVGFEVDHHG